MCNAYTATSFAEAYQQVLLNRIETAFAPPECFASANKRLERLMMGAHALFEQQFSVVVYDGTLEPHDAVATSGLSIQPEFVFTNILEPTTKKEEDTVLEETPELLTMLYWGLYYGTFKVKDEETEEVTKYTDIFLEGINLAHATEQRKPTVTYAGLEGLLIAKQHTL